MRSVDPVILAVIACFFLFARHAYKARDIGPAVICLGVAFLLAWQNIPGFGDAGRTVGDSVGLTGPVLGVLLGPAVMLVVAVYALARMTGRR